MSEKLGEEQGKRRRRRRMFAKNPCNFSAAKTMAAYYCAMRGESMLVFDARTRDHAEKHCAAVNLGASNTRRKEDRNAQAALSECAKFSTGTRKDPGSKPLSCSPL